MTMTWPLEWAKVKCNMEIRGPDRTLYDGNIFVMFALLPFTRYSQWKQARSHDFGEEEARFWVTGPGVAPLENFLKNVHVIWCVILYLVSVAPFLITSRAQVQRFSKNQWVHCCSPSTLLSCRILWKNGCNLHTYADDNQVYMHCRHSDSVTASGGQLDGQQPVKTQPIQDWIDVVWY